MGNYLILQIEEPDVKQYFPDSIANILTSVDPSQILMGTAANIPAAGTADRVYFATDTGEISYDNGTAWTVFAETVTDARVKSFFPDTIANILTNHTKAVHDGLGIDAATVDGEEAADHLDLAGTRSMNGDLLMGQNSLSNINNINAGKAALAIRSEGVDGNGGIYLHDNYEGNDFIQLLETGPVKIPNTALQIQGNTGVSRTLHISGNDTLANGGSISKAIQAAGAHHLYVLSVRSPDTTIYQTYDSADTQSYAYISQGTDAVDDDHLLVQNNSGASITFYYKVWELL